MKKNKISVNKQLWGIWILLAIIAGSYILFGGEPDDNFYIDREIKSVCKEYKQGGSFLIEHGHIKDGTILLGKSIECYKEMKK